MSTASSDSSVLAGSGRLHAARRRGFAVSVATFFAAVAVVGFTPTYWAPLIAGRLNLHPAIHVHAVLFFTWVVFLALQTMLVYRGRTRWHREAGLFGIALAALMVFSGVLAAIVSLRAGLRGPRPDVARTTVALSLSGMVVFTTFIAAGIASIRRPEWHRRLMLLASFELLQPGVGRLVRRLPGLAPSTSIVIATALVDVVLLLIILADRRSTGRVHTAWRMGAAFLLIVQGLSIASLHTALWIAFTNWLAAMGG